MPAIDRPVIPVTITNSRSDVSSSIRNVGKRSAEPTFPVWAPDGHMEMHTQSNINDLTRLGTVDPADGTMRRWSRTPPAGAAAPAAPAVAGAQVAVAPEDTDDSDMPRPATPKLDALRHELVTLGGQADPKWGVKSLEREITARRDAAMAGQPLPGPAHLQDSPDDDAA